MQTRTRRILVVAGIAAALGAAIGLWPRGYCRSAKLRYGLSLPQCPDGQVRQILEIEGWSLQRKGEGAIAVTATAAYAIAGADYHDTAEIPNFDVRLALVDTAGAETPLAPIDASWTDDYYGRKHARVTLPDVPDGDYLIRARVSSRVADSSIDLPVALYAPARIHALTDRPLYEPGNEVHFRALALRGRDLTPIDHRPGTWIVRDPAGEELLEEKAPAGEWGVARGSFPLDSGALAGTWTATWRSGDDEGSVSFEVRPFTLPRFRVEAAPDRPFYQAGERPSLSGAVVYSSGAPVAGAIVELSWSAAGAWPPPTSWLHGGLPARAVAGDSGRFTLELPEIPTDLQGQARLTAQLSAIDAAGDRVPGSASILLSQDAIQVQAITELDGGLVEKINNRVYLRVTTADGRPLPGADVRVRRAWDPTDEGIPTRLDDDSVARVQLDPGPPVSVVVPPMPVRVPFRAADAQISLQSAHELVSDAPPQLADRMAMESWLAPLKACAHWVAGRPQQAQITVRASPAGALTAITAGPSPLEACVADALRTRRLPAGSDRLHALTLTLTEAALPQVTTELVAPSGTPDGLHTLITHAALAARPCMAPHIGAAVRGPVPWTLAWQTRAGSKAVQIAWVQSGPASAPPPGVAACLSARLARSALPEPARRDDQGLIRLAVTHPYAASEPPPPKPTIMKGYELLVSATRDDRPVGETRLRMQPGQVPPLRIRATPVLARPGEEVTLALVRGPSYSGALPTRLTIHNAGAFHEIEVERDTRTARFRVPDDADGWFEVQAAGQRALIYVRPQRDLSLSITPEEPRYAPGASARLRVETRSAGRGARAAVGLWGVDASLGELVPLPGPDELGRVLPEVTMHERAFLAIDAQALVLGRIRGENAAEATILRVAAVPEPAALDAVVSASHAAPFEPAVELADRFYTVLSELHAQTRAWEASAPADEHLVPATMARLWQQALDACAARGEPVEDAFGRRLRLHNLPADLLALTAPQAVVAQGTRLPEDMESWPAWVRRIRP